MPSLRFHKNRFKLKQRYPPWLNQLFIIIVENQKSDNNWERYLHLKIKRQNGGDVWRYRKSSWIVFEKVRSSQEHKGPRSEHLLENGNRE